MINAITLLKRRHDLSVDEFQKYWRHQHADVIARLPGIQRYVQSHPLRATYHEDGPVYDGVAELWANDSQAFRDIGTSEAYIAVQTDEENFLDRSANALVLTDEHVIKEGPQPDGGVKCIRLFNRSPGMPVDDFQSYWRDEYGPLIAALPSLDHYVQYPARAGGYAKGRQPACDGFDITWFGSVNALRNAMNSTDFERARSNQGNFLAPGDCPQIIAREHVITG